jgi:methyl-accepting chemotaxis protein
VAWALTWSQMLILLSVAVVVCGLVAAAFMLQTGITQPIRTLTESLGAVGNGRINDPVWGTDRQDEIGEMARAGERLRKGLAETETLKDMARKGEVHLRIEGEASAVLGKVVAGVEDATEALRRAAAGLSDSQAAQQRMFGDAARRFDEFGPRFNELAMTVGQVARDVLSGAAADLRSSMGKVVTMADERTAALLDVAASVEESGKDLSTAVDVVKVKANNAIDGLTHSIGAFSKAADGAKSIQGAFFAACDRISSDAAVTADNISTLAQRLGGVVDTVDTQLQGKIAALGNLEQGIERTLGAIEGRARETTEAIALAASAMEQRTIRAEQRTEQSIGEFEDIVRIFRDEQAATGQPVTQDAMHETLTRLNDLVTRLHERVEQGAVSPAHMEALTKAFGRKIDLSLGNLATQANQFAEAFSTAAAAAERRNEANEQSVRSSLDEVRDIIDIFRNADPSSPRATATPTPVTPDVNALSSQIDALRNDIRELALRMTEERILMTAEMPAPALAAGPGQVPARPQRTLADVPAGEILSRLREVAEEMTATPTPAAAPLAPRTAPAHPQRRLTDSLKAFARSVRPLYTSPDPLAGLQDLAPELAQHAERIDAGAQEVAHAAALRAELGSITAELRALAQTARAPAQASSDDLRETAVHLGARAESLFTYLTEVHAADARTHAQAILAVQPPQAAASIEQTTDDLTTLAEIINKLEKRAADLSDEAVAANLEQQTTGRPSPAEVSDGHARHPQKSDEAIAAVYDSIERLNNIAAALARAGEATRLRLAASA